MTIDNRLLGSHLTPLGLLMWRKERKITQAQLATMLGKDRKTVVNWETGRTRMPDTILVELERLAFTLAPKPVPASPDRLTPQTARLRPDLALYGPRLPGGGHSRGPDHPENVGFTRASPHEPLPFSILESSEYIEALKWCRMVETAFEENAIRNAWLDKENGRKRRIDLRGEE